jgi:hypothetical protein
MWTWGHFALTRLPCTAGLADGAQPSIPPGTDIYPAKVPETLRRHTRHLVCIAVTDDDSATRQRLNDHAHIDSVVSKVQIAMRRCLDTATESGDPTGLKRPVTDERRVNNDPISPDVRTGNYVMDAHERCSVCKRPDWFSCAVTE